MKILQVKHTVSEMRLTGWTQQQNRHEREKIRKSNTEKQKLSNLKKRETMFKKINRASRNL